MALQRPPDRSGPESLPDRRPGDFMRLLDDAGAGFSRAIGPGDSTAIRDTHGTTVIAVKFKGGIINVGDRRATAGNYIMYDRADKIVPVSDHMLLGISGSYARAVEAVKYLKTAFKYYSRSQLQEMSLEGQLNEITRIMQQNVQMAMAGIGGFIPIVSAWDKTRREARIFFFDGLGARFETPEYAAAGSGSERIRGVFEYIVKTRGLFSETARDVALRDALALLEIAADLDSATGGSQKIVPAVKVVTEEGIETVPDPEIQAALDAIGGLGFSPGASETDVPETPHGL